MAGDVLQSRPYATTGLRKPGSLLRRVIGLPHACQQTTPEETAQDCCQGHPRATAALPNCCNWLERVSGHCQY